MRKINGRVVTGLGEGKYYISREGYRKQFNEKLGFDPVPGTLNLRLDEPFANKDERVIRVEGFRDGERIFGRCACYRVQINGIKAAIVRPEISSYPPDQIEVIAPIHLRRSLNLVDGDWVELMIE